MIINVLIGFVVLMVAMMLLNGVMALVDLCVDMFHVEPKDTSKMQSFKLYRG